MIEKNKNKQVAKISIIITSIFVIFLSAAYAFLNQTLTGTKRQVITAGNLQLEFKEKDAITLENSLPMYDEVGMIGKSFDFTLYNKATESINYTLKLKDVTSTADKLDTSIVKYGFTKGGVTRKDLLSNLENNVIDIGTIKASQTIKYSLRLWIDSSVEDETIIKNKSLSYRIEVEARLLEPYTEETLNGCDPVLGDTLVPVMIEDDGTVKMANVEEQWYDYASKKWANAVVLEDETKEYHSGEIIPENNIESYFVWIPRYKYKIFNDESYSGTPGLSSTAVQTIEVEFETKDKQLSNGTKKDEWLSHPAFQAFDSNGFWVGKFETGYKNVSLAADVQWNSANSDKIIIKPSVTSWRGITVGNAFQASYEYLRESESHMMKNTEWGAVAYLHHSEYGSHTSIRSNNNTSYLTGYAAVVEPTVGYSPSSMSENQFGTDESVTLPYNTQTGFTASTTGNISGVYDMAGGAHEYVMGYNQNASTLGGSSGITSLYDDFFTNSIWDKYYDKYSNPTNSENSYNYHILGDATGEMGPFGRISDPDMSARPRTSWYDDYACFLISAEPWFTRSGGWRNGSGTGIFSFDNDAGGALAYISFRVVLTP